MRPIIAACVARTKMSPGAGLRKGRPVRGGFQCLPALKFVLPFSRLGAATLGLSLPCVLDHDTEDLRDGSNAWREDVWPSEPVEEEDDVASMDWRCVESLQLNQ